MTLLYIYILSSEGVHIYHSAILYIMSTIIILLTALLIGILSGQQCMLYSVVALFVKTTNQ